MIDWIKEIGNNETNRCGYCDGVKSHCNGTCFTRTDFTEKKRALNKIEHINYELSKIPEKINEIKKRELDLRLELKKLSDKVEKLNKKQE